MKPRWSWGWRCYVAEVFGRPSRRTKRILQERGVSAPAVVQEIFRTRQSVSRGNPYIVENTEIVCEVTLQVQPTGAAPFTTTFKAAFVQNAIPVPGQTVSVVFDPQDPERIMMSEDQGQVVDAVLQEVMDRTAGTGIGDLITMALGGASQDEVRQAASRMGYGSVIDLRPGAQVSTGGDVTSRLERLAVLHASGQLSDEEFAQAKARLFAE